MELLDFPPEIFQNVVHELVLSGVAEAWKCRAVCRLFASEIHHNIFARQHLDVVSHKAGRRIVEATEATREEFLYNRTVVLRGANACLPNKIKKMVMFLAHEAGEEDASQIKLCTKKLCRAVANISPDIKILAVLAMDPEKEGSRTRGLEQEGAGTWIRDMLKAPMGIEGAIAAAVAIDNPVLFRRLLSQLPKDSSQQEDVYGSPILIASMRGSEEIVQIAIDYLRQLPKMRRRHAYVLSKDLLSAVGIAIRRKNRSLLKALIELHGLSSPPLAQKTYTGWLYEAVCTYDQHIFRLIIDIEVKKSIKLTHSDIEIMCRLGSTTNIKAILDKGLIDLDRVWARAKTYALDIAVRCGHSTVLTAFMDAGANIEGPPQCTTYFPPPLHTAVNRCDISAIQLLLKRGARLHEWSGFRDSEQATLTLALHTKVKAVYDVIRQAKIDREGGRVPGFRKAMRKTTLGLGL